MLSILIFRLNVGFSTLLKRLPDFIGPIPSITLNKINKFNNKDILSYIDYKVNLNIIKKLIILIMYNIIKVEK